MKTATIIMAVLLIVLCTMAVLLIIRYMRKLTELEQKAEDLATQEKGLQRRHNSLESTKAMLDDQARRQSEWDERRKHIYANFVVLDSDENKPSYKSIGKSLSSKIGYALRNKFPEIKATHDSENGGRTVYSIDFYVTPIIEEK